jgi:hypothetical protein
MTVHLQLGEDSIQSEVQLPFEPVNLQAMLPAFRRIAGQLVEVGRTCSDLDHITGFKIFLDPDLRNCEMLRLSRRGGPRRSNSPTIAVFRHQRGQPMERPNRGPYGLLRTEATGLRQ